MPLVFISHATADDKIVSQISEKLKAAGLQTWVDHEQGITYGDEWTREIQQATNDCDLGLFILSPASVKSNYCDAEWNRIIALGKKLYVAVIQTAPLADMPLLISRIQHANLASDFDSKLADLITVILGKSSASPDAPTPVYRAPLTGEIDPMLRAIPMSGRDDDLAKLKKLISEAPTLIIGVGGLGKSRLAAEIALTGDFPGGVVWHRCSPFSQADDVMVLLRRHYDLGDNASREAVLNVLHQRPALIVLDNAEDIPAEDARQAAYIQLTGDMAAQKAFVLLTSRIEWNTLKPRRAMQPSQLPLEAATQIVRDMSAALDAPEAAEHAEDIARAARQHPRLIEWAVNQVSHLGAEAVIRQLKSLASAEVQEALDEMVKKTLNQMVEVTKNGRESAATLKRLNICREGFTYEAARAITSEPDADTLNSLLSTLQTWRFVSRNPALKRYGIDPLVIAALGEDDSAHKPHYDYYYELARQHNQKQDYFGLYPDSDNLESAFEWTIKNAQGQAALNLFIAFESFMGNRGHFDQRLNWIQQIVLILENHPDELLRAKAQGMLAWSYGELPTGNRAENLKMAITAYKIALDYSALQAAPLAYATTQNNLGIAYWRLSEAEEREANLKRAINAFEAALKYRTPQNAPTAYSGTQNNLGIAYDELARVEEREANLKRAIKAYEAALEYQIPQNTPLDYATLQNNLGNAYADLAQIEEREANLKRAVKAYDAALVYWTQQDAPLDYAMIQNNLGTIYVDLAQIEEREVNLKKASIAYESALVYRTPQTAPLYYAQTHHNLGSLHEELGDLPGAIACWIEAEKYYQETGVMEGANSMRRAITAAEAMLKDKE